MYGNLMRISSEANVIFDEATVTFLTPRLLLEINNGILTVNNTHQKKNSNNIVVYLLISVTFNESKQIQNVQFKTTSSTNSIS